ncbi:MAG TPA: DUF2157 domain-containing protein [Candidatus Paceibacterota bacterium]|nr:DUF2157 domain-containing protein [Candidatus Paceibacterota bacterium]
MEKQKLLQEIESFVAEGKIKKSELIESFDKGSAKVRKEHDVSRILYYLGGGVVLAGIFIFISQYWPVLGSVSRVLVTLGSGVAAYVAGTFFSADSRFRGVGNAFHLIGAVLLPFGMAVFVEEAGMEVSPGVLSIIFLILSFGYIASFFLRRSTLFLFWSIVFVSALFFAFTEYLALSAAFSGEQIARFAEYRIATTGLSYLFLGYYFSPMFREQKDILPYSSALSGFLYGFGALGFFGSTLFLGGWNPNQSIFWEVLYPFLTFSGLFLSVYVKSRSLLIFSSIFLFGYIFKMTSEYFADNFGWALSLVVLGFALIAVGYLVVYLNKKFKKLAD